MRRALLLMVLASLAACRASQGLQAEAAAPASVVGAETEASSAPTQRPVLSTEVLPSMVNTATIRTETPLLQRPKLGSVILQTLAAGSTVQVLGALDNADGQWRSVGVGDVQGWVRATAIAP